MEIMEGQTSITDFLPEGEKKFILAEDLEKAEKDKKEKIKARNKAQEILRDAIARYVKEKTRARSKKAAQERDEILKSSRFDRLKEYDRFQDIQECYGWDLITEKERDELEALWIERENLKNHTDENGIYQDLVTKALRNAEIFLMELWEEDIQKAEAMRKQFDDEIKEAEEEWQRIKEQNRKEKSYVTE